MEEVLARPDLTGVYAKCPDCSCRSYCLRDGKLIVDLAALRQRSEVDTSDDRGAL